MRLLFTENNQGDSEVRLKNHLEVSFPGIQIAFSEQNPALLITRTSLDPLPLVLESWELTANGTAAAFTFSGGPRVTFRVETPADSGAGRKSQASERLVISAAIPEGSRLVMPYKTESGFSVAGWSPVRVVIASRDRQFALQSEYSSDAEIVISSDNPHVSYGPYAPQRIFGFEDSLGIARASEEMFRAMVNAVGDQLIAAYQENINFSSEQIIVSYIAAMGEKNLYGQALSRVPLSFRNSGARTYLSAPYFNTLESMNRSLTLEMLSRNRAMRNAAEQKELGFFTTPNLGDYLARETDAETVTAFLSMPAQMGRDFAPTVPEAAGIIDVCGTLTAAAREYAALLEPVIDACLERIAASCVLSGDTLTVYALSAGGAEKPKDPLPLLQAVETGMALINYGNQKNQSSIKLTGCLIVNSALNAAPKLDLHALGDLYARLARYNTFYPHSTVLTTARGEKVWVWHVSRSISYTVDALGDVTIAIDFPQENTHHLILWGVEPFRNIYIYDMEYRTDPRFETYNSSGYVYNAEAQTLLLKSRHKTQREIIRLIYSSAR